MWNQNTILNRARVYASKYSDAGSELDTHYVRVAFEQFCLDTLAFPVEQNISTVSNQREYTHGVVRVHRVFYDGQQLPIVPVEHTGISGDYAIVYPSRVVLSFSPPVGKTIRVVGYGVPANIDTVVLEPEQQLMDAVAMLSASKYLAVYADSQTQSRATVLLTNYQAVIQQFRQRYDDSVRVRAGDNSWSELNILVRAREYARRFQERVDDLDLHYVYGAWEQFCLDTSAFTGEHTINTVGNQREYNHPLIRVSRVYLDESELILLPEPQPFYRACAVYPNRIVLSFDPQPNQRLRIVGYTVPTINTVYLEPAGRLMDGIAMLAAYNYLIRYAEPQQLQSISLYQLEYRRIVEDFGVRHMDGVRQRGGTIPRVGEISWV